MAVEATMKDHREVYQPAKERVKKAVSAGREPDPADTAVLEEWARKHGERHDDE